jgi:hypothetical protein
MNSTKDKDLLEVVYEKLDAWMTPGFIAQMCPEEAGLVGAFKEDALSEKEALEVSND